MQILPPSACTARVTLRWRPTCQGIDIVPDMGFNQPSMFGAMPPVTMRPTPPRARSAKNAASLS